MKIKLAGGGMEVGGSCIYVQIDGHGILLDSGIRQGAGKDPMPDFLSIQEMGDVEAILISHAHLDHTGSLPVISKAYPDAPVFMNQITLDLTRALLGDSLRIVDGQEKEIPRYSPDDVEGMLGRVRVMRLLSPMEILPGIRVTLYPAGHIPGAVCMMIESNEGSLFYSGDVSEFPQRTVDGAKIPPIKPDAVLLEATYGNRLQVNRQTEEQHLVETVAGCVSDGGKVLIPVFALGRAQEIILILREAIHTGTMPNVPVYVDGMVRDICDVYRNNATFLRGPIAKRILKGKEPFYTDEIRAVDDLQIRDELLKREGPAVFLCGSGLLTGGPGEQYAAKLVTDENACILLTGYEDEESPGRALTCLLDESDETRHITLNGCSVPVKCRVLQAGLSVHADKSELMRIADRLGTQKIILVHGDSSAVDELGDALGGDYRRRVYRPSLDEEVEISLHPKKKQADNRTVFTLGKTDFPGQGDDKLLWDAWNSHYPKRPMTIEKAAYLWFGRAMQDVSLDHDEQALDAASLEKFVDILLESPYFVRDFRRMYMIRPVSEDELAEKQKSNEIKIQDVEQRIRELLPWETIRKISFFIERKEATICVDFPDAAPENEVTAASITLEAELGWTVSLSRSMNSHAAEVLLQQLFGTRLSKISYYAMDKHYVCTLNGEHTAEDDALKETFRQKTGWTLLFQGEDQASEPGKADAGRETVDDEYWFVPETDIKPLEQNMALSLMNLALDEEARPTKASVRRDEYGPYFDFGYVTPFMGLKYARQIEAFVFQSGWRVHIAQAINQSQLMNMAEVMCIGGGITVKKTSFLPGEMAVRVTTDVPLPESIVMTFNERTGCRLVRK